ncbi:MAG TPA: GxxExxY protein [Kofleriaceae bacterium]|jgi:GxxExxY protein
MSTEPSAETEDVARVVMDAAFTVHRALGPGFVESVYEEAMAVELERLAVPFARQLLVPILYRGTLVGQHRLDMLVADCLVVEIKAVPSATPPQHLAQIISYLKATERDLGLLLNFGLPTMSAGFKRVVRSSLTN